MRKLMFSLWCLSIVVLLAVSALCAGGIAIAASAAPNEITKKATADHVLRVGPSQTLRSVAEAARIARDGDTVEIEAGDYAGDVAMWAQNDLALRAVGAGREWRIRASFVAIAR